MDNPTIKDVIDSDNVKGIEKIVATYEIIQGKNLGYWENRLSW
jgi:hypothetical protein